jgi:chaperonin cofactor prefoldin
MAAEDVPMRNLQTIVEQIQREIAALQKSNKDLARRVETLENRLSLPPAKRSNSETAAAPD